MVIVSVAVLSVPWPSLAENWNDRAVLSPTPRYLYALPGSKVKVPSDLKVNPAGVVPSIA
jgi:hypothetical protein